MPKGDRLKLKADPEDGTTPIANLLLEALAMAKISGLQTRAILHLWRETYGWVDEDGKRRKEKKITLSEWARALDSANARLSHALAELESRRIIRRRTADAWGGYFYQLNTDISQWNSNCINLSKLADKVGIADFATVDQNATVAILTTVAQKSSQQLTKTQRNSCPKRNTLPLYKEILNKDKERKGDEFSSLPSGKSLPVKVKDTERGEKVKEVFARLDTLRGYRPPRRKAEAAAIIRMLKTYSPDQVISTYQELKSDSFWTKKELFMMSVESQIGAMLNGKDKAGRVGSGSKKYTTPEEYRAARQ